MNGIVSGFTGAFSGKGIGGILAVIAVLAVLYAFAPQFTPPAIAQKIRGATA